MMAFAPRRALAGIGLAVSAFVFAVAATPPPLSTAAPTAAGLLAGAARVDITPTPDLMVAPFRTVHDPVYVRALAVESRGRRAIIVIVDAPTINAGVSAEIVGRIAAIAHVSRDQVVLGSTHTHNVIRVDRGAQGIILPGSAAYVRKVSDAAAEAVTRAVAAMQPARVGMGRGNVPLVANRNEWSPALNRYIGGVDRTGKEPIDTSLGVVKFEALDGKPIGFLLNHAFEPVITMPIPSEISGDVPGETSRLIEERSGGAPALFTIGAAGVPLYRAEDTPAPQRRDHVLALLHMYGQALAEEALAVAGRMTTSGGPVPVAAASRPLVCPGKATTPFNLPDRCAYTAGSTLPACDFKTVPADPVTLGMGVLRIGDLAMVLTDANVTPALGAKLKAANPRAQTWIVALTFGPLRFVVDDAAFKQNTYEATATTARVGCAEQGYLSGAKSLISQVWRRD
jgi:neutral ceramidase